MFKAIVRKELRHHLASSRFWVGALLTLALAAASTLIAARDYNLRLDGYRERIADEREEIRAVTVYSYLQPLAVRPPEPLGALAQGFDSRLGTEVEVHLFAIPVAAAGGQRGNEFLASVPAVDLTTVVIVVLGLLAMLLTCDAVIGERENGMLRAVFANAVPRGTVLAGKLAGGLAAMAALLAAALLASLALLRAEVGVALTPDQWLRIAGLLSAYLVYLSLMLLVGLVISLHVRSTPAALWVSVFVWFVLIVALPLMAWTVAGSAVAVEPVKRETERRIAELTAEHERRMTRERLRNPLRAGVSGHTAVSFASGEHGSVRYRFGSARYYDALAEHYRFATAAGIRHAEEVFGLRQRYLEKLRDGERLGMALALPSPAFLLDRLAEAFAGTSIDEHDRFLDASRRYRLELSAYLKRQGALGSWRWFTDDPPGQLHPWPHYLGLEPEEVEPDQAFVLFSRLSEPLIEARVRRHRETVDRDPSRRLLLDGMPRFSYRGPDFPDTLRQGAAEAGVLLLLNAVAAAAAWARFRRYDLG